MANERKKVADIAIGDGLKGEIYRLDSITKNAEGNYGITLSDKTGQIAGLIPAERYVSDYKKLLNGAVIVNGSVLVGNDSQPLVKIRSLALAGNDSYKASEIFEGLSPEKISEYKAFISEVIKKLIKDEGLRLLVINCLTSDMLSGLATLPASLAYHGRYMGGALAATATVTRMVAQNVIAYNKSSNGLYRIDYDWSVLMSASLLHMIGIPDYITSERPWRYTDAGLSRGYMSLVQDRLETVIREKKIPVTDENLSAVLNIIACSVPRKSGIRAVTPEGRMFRAVLLNYEEIDQLAAAIDSHEFDEGTSYEYLRGIGYITADKEVAA